MKTEIESALIALHEYIEAREDKGDMEELKIIYNAVKNAEGKVIKATTKEELKQEFIKYCLIPKKEPDHSRYIQRLNERLDEYAAAVEAEGWLPYRDSKLSDYLYYIIQGKNQEVNFGYHANGRWYSVSKELIKFDVIYFRELPAPYQPKHQYKIGDKVLRRNSGDGEPKWFVTTVNETYLELIKEFPEDYKPYQPKQEGEKNV